MLKKIFAFLLIVGLIVAAGYCALNLMQKQEKVINENNNEINIENDVPETQEEMPEIWNTFVNTSMGYTFEYKQNWDIDDYNLDRIWLYLPNEDASILFASDTATQTGFPEYELISSEDFAIDTIETTVSLLKSEETRAIMVSFQTEKYPHFVMITYTEQGQQFDEEMMNLSKDFLSRITFQ